MNFQALQVSFKKTCKISTLQTKTEMNVLNETLQIFQNVFGNIQNDTKITCIVG